MEPCVQSASARAARSRARAAAAQKNKLAGDMFRDNMWDPTHSVKEAECDDTGDLDYPIEQGDDPSDYYYQVRMRLARLKAARAASKGKSMMASVSMSMDGKTSAEKALMIGGGVAVVAALGVGGFFLYKHYAKK